MATNTYYIDTANDDWYVHSVTGRQDGTNEIWVQKNNVITPNYSETGYGDILTSGIGTDVISAATLYLDEVSYTASRGIKLQYNVWIWNGSSFVVMTNGTNILYGRSPIVRQIVLTATEQGYINKTGKTSFRVTVGTVSAGQFKLFKYKAYETAQANALRLSVTHAPAATGAPQVISIMT